MKEKRNQLKLNNREIEPIEFGEIAIKYQYGRPVVIVKRKQMKINDEIFVKESKQELMN